MKITGIIGVAAVCCAAAWTVSGLAAEKLVILHTNDTHSQIEPGDDDLGGVVRRKALVDSVRNAQPEVMLVDAGDAVQGTLYFTLFGGEVESKVMNYLGYDLQILGNHEFDNGVEWIPDYWKSLDAKKIVSNYDLSDTPLEGMASPYYIKEVDGNKVGFIAINISPSGLIDPKKSEGVVYLDAIKAANALAWYLKNIEKVDKVVALTHIGYKNKHAVSDTQLAAATENIDVIIGGHSHTTVSPVPDDKTTPFHINAVGDTVIVAQTGRLGRNLGEIDIDFSTGKIDYKLLKIDKRLDADPDEDMVALIAPYKHKVDSVKAIKIGRAASDMSADDRSLLNWVADFVYDEGKRIAGDKRIDMAIMNKGGIRKHISKGSVTKGDIMEAFPFDNYVQVLDIKGADLLDVLDSMVVDGGNGVSRQLEAKMDADARKCVEVLLDGSPIDPDKTYRVATINYLATGGDGMTGLTRGTVVGESGRYLFDDMIDAFEKGFVKNRTMRADTKARMHY